jgi:hypothetical protein
VRIVRCLALSLVALLPGTSPLAAAAPLGTFVGPLFGHEAILEIRERADGRLYGFLPSEPAIFVVGGQRDGAEISLEFAGLAVDGAAYAATFEGTLAGVSLDGTLTDNEGATAVSLVLDSRPYWLEQWLVVDEDPDEATRLERVERPRGSFLLGGYGVLDECAFAGCRGAIDSWSEAGTSHAVALSHGGLCPRTVTLDAELDLATLIATGLWNRDDCIGLASGGFLAGKEGLADHAGLGAALDNLGQFADALEAESPTAIRAFAPGYLNDGKTRADWAADFSAIYAAYDALEAEIVFVRQVITANDAEVLPLIGLAPRLEWSFAVTGEPAGGGVREDVLVTTATFEGDQELFWIESAGRRRFVGNGFAEPFTIDMPILAGQGARVTFGLWPFGVHGGGHPEGHAGWDIEYAANALARAAADGVVVSIEDNDAGPGQKNVEINHRPGRSTVYHHLVDLEPGIAVGVEVGRGDPLGVAADFGGGHRVIHFSVRSSIDDVCPLSFLSPSGQAIFDATWATAGYVEELTEPFPCNPVSVDLPLVRTWTLESGTLPAAIELTRTDPTTQAYTYRLLDGDELELETGDVTFIQPIAAAEWGTLDLEPDGGGAAHLALYRIVGDALTIDWGALRPADLTGASVYRSSVD